MKMYKIWELFKQKINKSHSNTIHNEEFAEYEDIVDELKAWAFLTNAIQGTATLVMLDGGIFDDAADEILMLRRALNYAAGILSTNDRYSQLHPEHVYSEIIIDSQNEPLAKHYL